MNMFGMDVDPEELMDFEAVEENAYNYACDLVMTVLLQRILHYLTSCHQKFY